MPEKHLFEYAVIRVVPRVEREEFVNIGVILYCPRPRYLHSAVQLDELRLRALDPEVDIGTIYEQIQSFKKICGGGRGSGPIGELDVASRFRWLTAVRSTVVQTSRVHPGFCAEMPAALEKLMADLVH